MKTPAILLTFLSTLFWSCRPHHALEAFSSMDDLKEKRIGVLMGSIQDEYVTKTFPAAEILRIDMSSDLIMSLKTNQCDAIVLPKPEAKQILAKNDDLSVLVDDIFGADFGIGIGFRDPSLREMFNQYLTEIRADGRLDAMANKWIDNTEHASMPTFPSLGKQPLVVGTTAQSLPFSYMQDNLYAGFDIELVSNFAASLGRPVTYAVMNFGALIPALAAAKIDVIANMVMITQERQKQVLFSEPYYYVGSTVLVRKVDRKAESVSLCDGSDIATARIATMTGSNSAMFLEEHYPQARLLLFDDINDAFLALLTAKADYVLTSYTTSLLATKHNRELRLLPKEYINDPSGIALNKKDTALLRQINGVLERFKKEGILHDIVDRWIRIDGSDYMPLIVSGVKQGKPLRVGTAANREPMCFISNGKISGLDAELIERIASELGRPVEYVDMKFSALIAALESGRVDVVVSNYGITPERLMRVHFSDSYYTNPQILTTLSNNSVEGQGPKPGWFKRVRESFMHNIVTEKRYMLILEGFKQTMIITFFSIILGTLFGGLICSLRMSRNKFSLGFARVYISLMRGTPILVLLMIFFYVVFASTGLSASFVAVITFALNMGAYSSEMFRAAIESVDRGQTEAGIALGFTKLMTFVYVVFPQALKRVIPVYKGEVISLLKMTSIVGYVAVVDLTKASDIIRSRTFDAFFPLIAVAVIYFLLAWLLGLALDSINLKKSF